MHDAAAGLRMSTPSLSTAVRSAMAVSMSSWKLR